MNNEEKILAILERLTEETGRHSEMLTRQGEMITRLGETLARHDEILARHDEMLEKLVRKVDQQGELLEELDSRSLRSAVMLENDVLPKLQLLYEGQVHLQETLAPKERVEVLEDDVITLKSAVKMMTKRLEALERAQ